MTTADMTPPPATSASRRTFFKWATMLCGAGVGLLAGVPSLLAFLSPARRRPPDIAWVKLGEADLFDIDVPTKVSIVQTVKDAWVDNQELKSVWVYTPDGEAFTVFNGRCTHLGCSYNFDAKPDLPFHAQPDVYHCPCHHGVFDEKTGAVLAGPPPRPLDRLEWKIEDGMLYTRYEDFRVGTPQKIVV